ncbi:PE-PPE domain-containing protein [Mycolicibacterium fallax]|uniref:PE-PPE domain-containing protein n=1 Tax=Mycolicibacterium fallax TaxID=1793 RepID=A0A1X1RFS9_MYCFA|nr:PE-PPE domain-containing protein [Mycolicibacterium fallax]ORV04540.1 hypothetical protein AWC04_08045 [Mycolicibacterium fallax]BBY99726.1 hypothetical protein MFAL_31930 [Mycolicibacterium fallax]
MGQRRRKRGKAALVGGAALAAAVSMGIAPTAQAITSQTTVVGVPEWLQSIVGDGGGVIAPPGTSAEDVYNVLATQDPGPMVGWGVAPNGVELKPEWVTWVDSIINYGLGRCVGGCTSHGQWVSPTGVFNDNLKPKILSGEIDLQELQGLEITDVGTITGLINKLGMRDSLYLYSLSDALSDENWSEAGVLASVLNWTAYIQNTNLIGFGDGNLVVADAYRQFVQAVKDGDVPVGAPLTEGTELTIVSGGEQKDKKLSATWSNGFSPKITYPDAPGVEFTTNDGGVVDITAVVLAMLRNPGRGNGGLYTRFRPLYEALNGVDPLSPERENVLPDGVTEADLFNLVAPELKDLDLSEVDNVGELMTVLNSVNLGATDLDVDSMLSNPEQLGELLDLLNAVNHQKMLVTIKADATWAYDYMSDAPVTANPIAWANSAMSVLSLLDLAGVTGDGDISKTGLTIYQVPEGERDAGTYYLTLTQNQLPLVAPLRLPAQLISKATGEQIGTPVADTFEPLLKILTNIGYTDVITPQQLANGEFDPAKYDAYDRSYLEMHNPVLFGTQTLELREIAQLQGDLLSAVGQGLHDGWNSSVRSTAYRLMDALGVERSEELDEVLAAPADAIRKVGAEAGATVSDALVKLHDALPQEIQDVIKTDTPEEQERLGEVYKFVGEGLVPVKQGVDQLNAEVTGGLAEADAGLTGGRLTKAVKQLTANPVGPVLDAATDLQKRGTKLQSSLTKAQKDADDVVESVKSGNPKDIGNTVKAKVDKRVDRAKKDLDNGVAKVKETVKKVKDAVKKVTKTGE